MSDALERLQQQMQSHVLGSGAIAPSMHALISSNDGLSTEGRLAIYFEGYRMRLRQALGEAFDKTHALVGDALFSQLCDGYIADQPSAFRNLRWYGDGFAGHLATALPSHPCVAELAQFEWALGLAFDAADAPLLTLDSLATVTPEEWAHIGFTLQPALQLLTLEWNVAAIWLALEAGQTPPAPQAETAHWLVWRRQWQPHFRSLPTAEFKAIQDMSSGASFASVCADALIPTATDGDVTAQVAGWLQTWVAEEILSAVVRTGSVRTT